MKIINHLTSYLITCIPIKNFRQLLSIIFIFGLIPSSYAQQLSFNKTKVEGGYHFNYQWIDRNNAQQAIDFTLSNDGLFNRFRDFKSYQSSYAQKDILRRIKKHLQNNPIADVQVNYLQDNDNLSIEVKSIDEKKVTKAYKTIQKLQRKYTQEYFTDNYYQTFTDYNNIQSIKVNHVSIANDAVNDLKSIKPMVLDSVSVQGIREVIGYVLGLIQSIPYNPLESRVTSSGSGFNHPLQVLWENQGDCDSKMTLTAALLRALMPRIKMALIYIEGHAFIGINIPAAAGELTITHQRVKYVLAEPTGPALLPLGVLAPDSALAINQGHYSVQAYHEVLQP